MVLDTSAIIAAIANEQDGPRYRAAMLGGDSLLISAVVVLETKVVLFARLGSEAVDLFDELLEKAGLLSCHSMMKWQEPPSMRFDVLEGQGHPAQLNIVDCAAYALAKARSQSLLFKGGDFARTDVVTAAI